MMHEQSNVTPCQSMVELIDGGARITLTDPESVSETQDGEGNTIYEYTRYVLQRKCKPGEIGALAVSVDTNFDAWLAMAKTQAEEYAASEARKIRNQLLSQSDAHMTLDRIGLELPTGTTITSWLPFIQKIGGMVTGEWAAYRQALRDIPQQEGFPENVIWPTQPRA